MKWVGCTKWQTCLFYFRKATNQVDMLACTFGDCCTEILMPRQLTAGSLI